MDSAISVVIAAYAREELLVSVVTAVLGQSLAPHAVFVVHSGPDDPRARLAGLASIVHCEHHPGRLLAGAARNLGLQRVRTPLVAFLDADTVPVADWLEQLHAVLSRAAPIAVVGSVGQAGGGGYWGRCVNLLEFSSVKPYLPPRTMIGGGGGNLLVSTAAVRAVGGFPGDLATGEDTLLLARLRALGRPTRFAPRARVDHRDRPGLGHLLRHLFHNGRGAALSRARSGAGRGWRAAPVLGPARLALVGWRVLRWGGPPEWAELAIHGPGVALGCAAWQLGFVAGLGN